MTPTEQERHAKSYHRLHLFLRFTALLQKLCYSLCHVTAILNAVPHRHTTVVVPTHKEPRVILVHTPLDLRQQLQMTPVMRRATTA